MHTNHAFKRALLCGATVVALMSASAAAHAQTAEAEQTADDATAMQGLVVSIGKQARSAVALPEAEIQKILPGVSPLKAIQTLPGVLYETADPWGNNEQNISLIIHGFTTQQLGFTLDGVPLGDQQYGNYNGLSPSRAITSENVRRVVLSSGAGSLGVASTSNLGGAIETFSRNPSDTYGIDLRQTVGSYEATRTYVRLDTGSLLGGNAFVSFLHYDARAWDFDAHQKGDQANLKWVRDSGKNKLTFYADWQKKVEPNEDATGFGNQQTAAAAGFTPYTRPFIYPNYQAGLDYLNGGLPGSPPVSAGNNFSNYFSAAQREDVLSYFKLEHQVSENIDWEIQPYFHYNYGRGIVAGPINQAGLPGLFAVYFPQLVVGGTGTATTLQNISDVFGGTGYEVRTTEYKINRGGAIANLHWQAGNHKIEAGAWYERDEDTQHRVWYPFTAQNNDLTPYDVPRGPAAFTQYAFAFKVDDVQFHLQDQWRIAPTLELQAGFKSSLQTARGVVTTQQRNAPGATNPTLYPSGTLVSNEGLLPQIGLVWDASPTEQVFANVQKNLRQFIPYGAGSNFYGASPWSLGSQLAFDQFKDTVEPETSWTYEAGVRTRRMLDGGFLNSVEAQASVYHVDFSNRLLNIASYNFINPGAGVLANVGGVTTDGIDVALTVNFGDHFRLYDAVSYNKSKYDNDYSQGAVVGGVLTTTTVATGGKQVPLTPNWLNKTILSASFGPFEAQLSGDYVGKRYATYLNDLSIKSTFLLGLEASYSFDLPSSGRIKSARLSANVTNLANEKGVSTAVVTGASGGYQAFPLPPRMVFVTLQGTF